MHCTAIRLAAKCIMFDQGFFLSWQAVRRQLAAMPNDLYLVRLIHQTTRRAFPGERLWTATQLVREPTIRFLRMRNREGCDIYIQPYSGSGNPGYILLDLDHGGPAALNLMRTQWAYARCRAPDQSRPPCRLGFESVPILWNRPSPAPLPNNWPGSMGQTWPAPIDRKSTRLNSSHLGISYAVF